MTNDNSPNITRPTVIGFGLICILFCFVGIVSVVEINLLGNLTSTIYKHPLEVSNAALRASMGVVKMHRSMKDVVLSDEQLPLETAVSYVADEESIVFQKLELIQEKILGAEGKALLQETKKLFVSWKPIREEVIDLVKRGDKEGAARITKGKGAHHESILEQKMLALTSYARGKADDFIEQANRVRDRIFYTIIISVALGFFMSVIIAVFTFRKLTTAIDIRDRAKKELENTLAEIKTLRGILPICSVCKKIRDDEGYWSQVEVYVEKHSEADFSHSFCPECAKIHYPKLFVGKETTNKK